MLMPKADGALIQVKGPRRWLRHGFRTAQRMSDPAAKAERGGPDFPGNAIVVDPASAQLPSPIGRDEVSVAFDKKGSPRPKRRQRAQHHDGSGRTIHRSPTKRGDVGKFKIGIISYIFNMISNSAFSWRTGPSCMMRSVGCQCPGQCDADRSPSTLSRQHVATTLIPVNCRVLRSWQGFRSIHQMWNCHAD
jgi:hypothetical protein